MVATNKSMIREAARAALPAAALSGLPSTLDALARRRDPLEASLAAGSMLLPREQRRVRLVAAAVPVHLGLSFAWTFILSATLPRRRPIAEGIVAGLAIAALDLGVAGGLFPRIRKLRPFPQVADHVAFGILVATALVRRQEIPAP